MTWSTKLEITSLKDKKSGQLSMSYRLFSSSVNVKMATLGNGACDDSGGGDGDDDVLPPCFLPPFPLGGRPSLPPWQIGMTPQKSVKGAQKTAHETLRGGGKGCVKFNCGITQPRAQFCRSL